MYNKHKSIEVTSFNALIKFGVILMIIFISFVQFQWVFGLKDFSSFGKMFIPMAEETAVLFVIAGIILVLGTIKYKNKYHFYFNLFLILVIGAVSIVTLIDIATKYVWGGSDFIGTKGLIRAGFQTGKMSFLTSICFILVCLALLLIHIKKEKYAIVFSAPVLLISFIIIIGYSHGVPFFYESKYIPMSWPTSIVFVITCFCLIFASGIESIPLCYFYGDSTRSLLLRNLFPSIFLLLIVTDFFNSFNNNHQSISNTLISSGIDIIILIGIGIFISRVSKKIGNDIDTHILERKLALEKLQEISQAVEQSPISIIITDINGLINYVNPKFEKISGYTLEEVKGKNPNILKSGYTSASEYSLLWDSIKNGKNWQGEFLNKNKKGELYWEFATISAIKNDKGEIINYLVLKEDINDRKKVEDKLRKISWKQNHEIRAPLTTIMGIISAMKYKISIEEKLFFLEQLDDASKKLDTSIKAIIQEAELIPKNI